MLTAMTYKICICGDAGVGKSTYVKMLLTNNFEKKFVPTIGCNVQSITFNTNYGVLVLHLWDVAGQEKCKKGTYCTGADGILLMADIRSKISRKNLKWWYTQFIRNTNEKNKNNFCVVLNKIDTTDILPKEEEKVLMSIKNRQNLLEPLLRLTRLISGKKDLEFI